MSRPILKEFRVWIKGPTGFLWQNNKGLKISCLCTFKMTYKERKHVIFIEKSPEERILDGKGHLLAKGPWSESPVSGFLGVFLRLRHVVFPCRIFQYSSLSRAKRHRERKMVMKTRVGLSLVISWNISHEWAIVSMYVVKNKSNIWT
jgi:hypothetical protein